MIEREIATVEDAISLLDEWISAYNDLKREHLRTLWEMSKLRCAYEHAGAVIDNDRWIAEQFKAPQESECPF